MQHTNSIVIHRNESGHGQIFVLDYENGRQVGDTRELSPDHAGHAAILRTLNESYEAPTPSVQVDTGALAKRIVDQCVESFACTEDHEAPIPSLDDVAHTVTAIKLEIERALAGIEPVEDEAHVSRETAESAAVPTGDLLDTQPLTASE